ncbi:MAG: substrate-binding domain-containing protein [Victivallales bacterium]|nr:substrate-binding domain-containing protein [Victivallales bacterium]
MLESNYKHEKLTALLRTELNEREFPGRRFHTIKYMMEHYGVSQATLSRALQPLFEDGLLYTVEGKGTFVADAPGTPDQHLTHGSPGVYCIFSEREVFERNGNPTDWFVLRDIIAGVTERGRELGWQVNLCPMKSDLNEFRQLAQRPDSVFIFTRYDVFEPLIRHCMQHHLPYSVYGIHTRLGKRFNHVWVDIAEATAKTTAYLLSRGHSRIAYLGSRNDHARYIGYKRALNAAGERAVREYCVHTPNGMPETAETLTKAFLSAHPEVTAMVCGSDLRASGAVKAALSLGRKPPAFAVTGVDNVDEIFSGQLRLTTVDLMRRNVGSELLRLAAASRDGKAPVSVKVETRLCNGDSA